MTTQPTRDSDTVEFPAEAAAHAGLRHTSIDRPGITRERSGTGWIYRDRDGEVIRDERVLERIRSIVIPPAWTDVWICTDPRGHIQATGFDARGRKQYRYHPKWRAYRDETKFGHLAEFGRALPQIRAEVERDLARPGFPRPKVLATVVKLLDLSLIRVGNKGYAKANGSYGLTTLRNRHVKIDGATIHFSFKGKGGIQHTIDLHDRRLASIVKRMRELPGYHVFQYLDSDGARHDISSEDVNAYLRAIGGKHFTAKDFRTWAGTVRFIAEVLERPHPATDAEGKRDVVAAIKAVSRLLGNTPAVCRASYIHPVAIEAFLDGEMLARSKNRAKRSTAAREGTRPIEELILLDLLRQSRATIPPDNAG